jgi:hypothetical protein
MAKQSLARRLLAEFRRKGGGSRQSTLRVLGSKLERNGAPFSKERLEFEDADGPRTVDVVETGTCSFGHVVDDKVRVAGICELGGEVLCSTEGCMLRCDHCGAAVCHQHGQTRGERTYCSRHRWIHLWRLFWRLN